MKQKKNAQNNIQYVNITPISDNPELFLKIYKAIRASKMYEFKNLPSPQALANIALKDCQNGFEYAQFLIAPENPILTVCRVEGISRSDLAKLLGIRVSRLENCLSRKRCSKSVLKMLAERFNYIKGE